MNETIKTGEVFVLGDLAQYQDGAIVNVVVTQNEKMRVALKAFDAGCVLEPHTAPGNVIFCALEGEAVITSEGVDYPIKAGENFFFAKGELHAVRATTRFKMLGIADLG